MNGQENNSTAIETTENYARPGFARQTRRVLGPSTREVLDLLKSLERSIPRAVSA